ncbi:MAG: ATP-binding protein [Pseudomonadota bacterium]
MSLKTRYLKPYINEDIEKKMVFIGGPRQVGKTTLALSFLDPPSEKNKAYLNWDIEHQRSSIIKGELPSKQEIIIFDEIHKYSRWRNLLKGHYDYNKSDVSFIVTGSARLDHYRKGGDSLFGRYFYYRLHPFSLMELNKDPNHSDMEALLEYGGFPEPFLSANKKTQKRWQRERLTRVVYTDINDIENVKDISLIQLLVESLPDRVGSPLSIGSLKEDLQVSFQTAAKWLDILDSMYLTFRISPFGAPKIRAVKKEQKLYFWDWSMVSDDGNRFENFVACQLLKYCHFIEDTEGDLMELRFIRDTDKREVDFVVLRNKKPLFAIECKSKNRGISPHIKYFKERTDIPNFYQVHRKDKDFGNEKTTGRVLPFTVFCKELGMP